MPKKIETPSVLKTRKKYEGIVDLLEHGAAEYKFSKKGPFEKLNVEEACKEYGVSRHSFYTYMNRHPRLYAKLQFVRSAERESLKDRAQSNLEKILGGELQVENKELGRLSLDVLKSIEKSYNPKSEIELTSNDAMTMSMDEILGRIEELKNK